jgi:uncharacterized membrane protein YdjX (TVP38/TMEM64 family)
VSFGASTDEASSSLSKESRTKKSSESNSGSKTKSSPSSSSSLLTTEVKLALALVSLILLLCYFLPVSSYVNATLQWLESLDPVPSALLFIALYAVMVVTFLPAMILSLGAGYLWGFWHAQLLVNVGATIGSALAFVLGKRVFKRTVASLVARYPLFSQVDEAFAQSGWKLIVLLRISPLTPYNVMNYAMSLTAIDVFTYTWASAIGMIPQTALTVYAGAVAKDLMNVKSNDGDATSLYVGIGLTVASSILIGWVVNRELKKVLAASKSKDKTIDV